MNAGRIAWSIVGVLSLSGAVRGTDPVAILAPSEAGGFVRGHIFVAMEESEACDFGGQEWIIEIDPDTGDWSIFADSNDGLCYVNGLRFTPDGSRLLAANFGHLSPSFDGGWIQAFHPDGTSEIILDASDGLLGPNGSNCLAFDRDGDLYVVSAENSRILRFPRDGSPATIFADHADGIDDRGALDFSPSGDLFYTGDLAGKVLQINPEGQSTVFDQNIAFSTLAFDNRENLFAARGSPVYRYDGPGPDPTTRRILAGGFNNINEVAIALSPDQRWLYRADSPGFVFAIDADTGASALVADFSELSSLVFPNGATVYAPDPDLIPGRCCFALHTPSPGCIDGVTRPECGDDEAAPFLFTAKEDCPPDGPRCETVTGACCNNDAFGGCTDETLISQCQCPTCNWHESQTCVGIECTLTAIPTASAWGLAVLTLLLMIGAKIVFGGRGDVFERSEHRAQAR